MDRKRKRNSAGTEAHWTAARCQRLLRPIASRIAPLRNHSYITDSQKSVRGDNQQPSQVQCNSDTRSGRHDQQDPAWLRRPHARDASKTYSSKYRTSKRSSSSNAKGLEGPEPCPNECLISLPTPFKARALRRNTPSKKFNGEYEATPCFKPQAKRVRPQKKDPFSFAPVAMQSAEFHNRQTFEKVFELHQGVVDGYSLLLQKTAHPTLDTPSKGARSLFSTCLRCIPDYIQAEEDWRKDVDPDDETDVGAEVYEELEGLSSSYKHGWPSLREVVRAHGTKLVKDIIQDKLVSIKTRAELANLLLQRGTLQDAERLVVTIAYTLPLKRPLNPTSPLFAGCLANLADVELYNNHPESTRTQIRILDSLFDCGRLHITWVATKDVTTTLSRAIRTLASQRCPEDSGHIPRFIENIVGQMLDARSFCTPEVSGGIAPLDISSRKGAPTTLFEGAFNTLQSVVTVLTAMAVIPAKQGTQGKYDLPGSSRVATTIIERLATSILHQHQSRMQESSGSNGLQRRACVKLTILASILVITMEQGAIEADAARFTIGTLVSCILCIAQHAPSTISIMDQISSFISNLAICCGQSLNFNAQDILEDFVHKIAMASAVGPTSHKHFLQQLALETALTFSALAMSREAKMFANKMEKAMSQPGSLPLVSGSVRRPMVSKDQHESYRWEEGLCEWIAATPLPARVGEGRLDIWLQKSQSSSEVCEESNDSGYLTSQETPQPIVDRRQMNFSSPDILFGTPQPLAVRRDVHPQISPRKGIDPLQGRPRNLRDNIQGRTPITSLAPMTTTNAGSSVEKARTFPSDVGNVLGESLEAGRPNSTGIKDAGFTPPTNLIVLDNKRATCGRNVIKMPIGEDMPNTPAFSSSRSGHATDTCEDDDPDCDELAMSGMKASIAKDPVGFLSKASRNSNSTASTATRVVLKGDVKRSRHMANADSEDELG